MQLVGTCEVAEGTTLARLELQVEQGTFRGFMGVGDEHVRLCACVYVYFLCFYMIHFNQAELIVLILNASSRRNGT